MKSLQKFLSVFLIFALMLSGAGISAAAVSAQQNPSVQDIVESPEATAKDKLLWNAVNAAVQGLLRTICFFYPNPKMERLED